jgi:hypothetical protein
MGVEQFTEPGQSGGVALFGSADDEADLVQGVGVGCVFFLVSGRVSSSTGRSFGGDSPGST